MSNKHCPSKRKHTIVNRFPYHLQSTHSVCNTSNDKSTSFHPILTYNLQLLSPKKRLQIYNFFTSEVVDSTTRKVLNTHVGSNLMHTRNTLDNLFLRTFYLKISYIAHFPELFELEIWMTMCQIFAGLCMAGNNLKYFYTILLPLLEENFEKSSKTQKKVISLPKTQ